MSPVFGDGEPYSNVRIENLYTDSKLSLMHLLLTLFQQTGVNRLNFDILNVQLISCH